MPTVLVVDDSAVDRRFVGGILGGDADLAVQYAADGAEALARIERAPPELVVTDLVMPEMNGLELVAAVRRSYPLVPVILMTSQGNEEIAVRALRAGAASYVPKRTLAQDLLDTIHSVLAVSRQERSHTRLMGCMTHSECAFVLDNDSSLFYPLVVHFQGNLAQLGIGDAADRTRIGVALMEALANALYHGNLEIGPELREQDQAAYDAQAMRRPHEAPYANRRIHVEARLSRTEAVFVVRDQGCGFDPSALPDPTDPVNLEKLSGRGILLMRTFMDEVLYNNVGNAVTLTKRLCEASR